MHQLEGRRAAAAKGKEWKSIDKEEFLAFIGLTLLAGGDKSWDVALRELFLDPLQNPIYKATMGLRRYENIRRFIRFDDRRTRALRLETDHMTAFRYVWECFLDNCRRRFIPSDCVTIDEQLAPFRGRCRFLQYMPSKPAKYGLKIFWMCDAKVPYAMDQRWAIIFSRGHMRNLDCCKGPHKFLSCCTSILSPRFDINNILYTNS